MRSRSFHKAFYTLTLLLIALIGWGSPLLATVHYWQHPVSIIALDTDATQPIASPQRETTRAWHSIHTEPSALTITLLLVVTPAIILTLALYTPPGFAPVYRQFLLAPPYPPPRPLPLLTWTHAMRPYPSK